MNALRSKFSVAPRAEPRYEFFFLNFSMNSTRAPTASKPTAL